MNKTKRAILDTSIALFGKHGFNGTSVRDIAKSVGVQQGALYNHFKNKDEILETLAEELMNSTIVGIFADTVPEELAKKGKGLLQSISKTFKLISFDRKNEALFKLMMQEIYRNETIRNLYLEYFYQENLKKLSSIFFIMMQNETIESNDPLLLANEFLAPLFFYQSQITMLKIDDKSTSSAATLFEKHADIFWESIRTTKNIHQPISKDSLF